MKEYHKINSIFKRDMGSPSKMLLEGQWACDEFCYLSNNEWVFTEKVDGTNIRIMIAEGQITFGGKTDNAQIPAALVKRLQEKFLPLATVLGEMFSGGACIYGEGYGAKIQKGGGNYRPDQDFVMFDIRVGDRWLQRVDAKNVSSKLGIDIVPIIGRGSLMNAVDLVKRPLQSRWGAFMAEGIVARPAVEFTTRSGARIITKIKCRDFAPVSQ